MDSTRQENCTQKFHLFMPTDRIELLQRFGAACKQITTACWRYLHYQRAERNSSAGIGNGAVHGIIRSSVVQSCPKSDEVCQASNKRKVR